MPVLDKRLAQRYRVGRENYAVHAAGARRIRDISLGGLFLEDPDCLDLGADILFELNLDGERLPFKGIVKRVVPRVGMGIQFQNMTTEGSNRLERILHRIGKPIESSAPPEEPRKPSPPGPEPVPLADAAGPSLPTSEEGLTVRLAKLKTEIADVENALKSGEVDPRILQQFRDAVDQVRQTAWAVQEWMHRQEKKSDPYELFPLLSKDRVRRATQLSRDIVNDIEGAEITLDTEGLADLLHATEELYRHLSTFYKTR